VQAREVEILTPGDDVTWIEIDLTPWMGQATTLSLAVEGDGNGQDGAWNSPQLTADGSWLLASIPRDDPSFVPTSYGLGDSVRLRGYALARDHSTLDVRLYWEATRTIQDHAKVFVHLLDATGDIISQRDSVPVAGTYPLPAWIPGVVIVDDYRLPLPDGLPDGSTVAVGLYDPRSSTRWAAVDDQGEKLRDDRILLPLEFVAAGIAAGELSARGQTP
jgi:hypothetical protein